MAVAGVGTTFERGIDSSGYTAIAEIKSIGGPTSTRSTIDTTALDTAGGYRTFITGFRDAGTVTLNMNYTEDGYITMKADFESDSEVDYRITLPTYGTVFDFAGFVTDIPLDIPADDVVSSNVTIKVSGMVTISSS